MTCLKHQCTEKDTFHSRSGAHYPRVGLGTGKVGREISIGIKPHKISLELGVREMRTGFGGIAAVFEVFFSSAYFSLFLFAPYTSHCLFVNLSDLHRHNHK